MLKIISIVFIAVHAILFVSLCAYFIVDLIRTLDDSDDDSYGYGAFN